MKKIRKKFSDQDQNHSKSNKMQFSLALLLVFAIAVACANAIRASNRDDDVTGIPSPSSVYQTGGDWDGAQKINFKNIIN
jgi:hypothetical protein